MRQLFSAPLSNNTLTFYLPKGQFGNLMVVYAGTTDAGQTWTRADLGQVRLNWNGDDAINVDAEILNLLDNIYGGVAEATFAAAGANRAAVIIPSGLWFDSANVFDVGDTDRVFVKLDFSAAAAKCSVAGGTVTIFAKPKIGVMNYLHKMVTRNINSSGAFTYSDTFPISNVSQVYLKNPSGANVSHIQLNKNSETVVDADTADVNAYSDWIHQLEATNSTIAIDFGETKDIRENVGSQISFKYTFSGAGTLEQYFSYIEFTNKKAVESRTVASNKIIQNVNKSLQSGL